VKRFLLLIVVLVACLVPGCIGEIETYTDEGQAIDTGVNQQFVIALGSNLTTGYGWQASYDETMIELVEWIYKEEAKNGLLGGGGVEYFRFKALKSARTEITLVYKRAWEEEILAQKVFVIHIR
jgi:predicted secreted protein